MHHRFPIFAALCMSLAFAPLRGNCQELSGRVVEATTGNPLVGATVYISPNGPGTVTNSEGEFHLSRTKGDSLVVRFIGYHPAHLAQKDVHSGMKVELRETSLLYREVTVTATRHPASAADIASPVEIVRLNNPRLATAQNVGEAVGNVQSLFIKDYGGLSGVKTVTLRGASEAQVLVLEDGFRINNPQGGWTDLNLLPLIGVDRIEVLRGGASAQYGSEAMGGIIHIRTLPPPERFSPSAEYTFGSYGTGAGRVSLGQKFGKFSAIAAFGAQRTDGDYPTGQTLPEKLMDNGLERQDYYVRADYSISPSVQLAGFHKDIHSDRDAAGSLSFPTPGSNQVDNNRMTALSLSARHGNGLDLSVQMNVQRLKQDYLNPDPFFPVDSHHRVDATEAVVHNRSSLGAIDLLYGFELGRTEISSTDILEVTRDQRSAFAQAEWQWVGVTNGIIRRLAIMPAIRVDDFSDAGTHASPRLSAVWKWERRASVSLHGSAGRSFRVPSLNDLFWPSQPYLAGNPNLAPEEGMQYDAGVLAQLPSNFGSLQFAFDVYHLRLNNLISWIPDDNFRYSPQNISKAHVTGLEPAVAWRSKQDRLALRVSYNYLRSRDAGDDLTTAGKKLLYRPANKLDVMFSTAMGHATLGASYQLIGERFVTQDNSVSLPGYKLTNLFGRYELPFTQDFRLQLGGAINNLFDKRYQVLLGYPTPGRELRVTMGVLR